MLYLYSHFIYTQTYYYTIKATLLIYLFYLLKIQLHFFYIQMSPNVNSTQPDPIIGRKQTNK